MKKWIGLLGIVAAICLAFGGIYNGLNSSKIDVDTAYSKVDTELQRRYDLIPRLVSTAKGYMAHEEKVFTEIAEARSKLSGAKTSEESMAASKEMEGALSRLLVITENYPTLKSDENFRVLMAELAGTENRIKVSRTDYNDVVARYNKKVTSFPTVILARLFNFEKALLFEADNVAKTAPEVTFD